MTKLSIRFNFKSMFYLLSMFYNKIMIYSLRGVLVLTGVDYFVIDVGGIGFKIFSTQNSIASIAPVGDEVSVFCRMYVKEDELHLYGFFTSKELEVFELLNSVNGVGPRSALAIMNVAKLDELLSAIKENRPDVLSKASGIGKKIAERIALELRDKTIIKGSAEVVEKMEGDSDIVETLVGLGYTKEQVRRALQEISNNNITLEERLKATLRFLNMKKHH